MDSTYRRAGYRGVAPALAAVLVLAALAGCQTSPATPGPGQSAAADAVLPGITASRATSPLPAGTPGRGKPAVTIGTKDFPEQFLLGELYQQALAAKGFDATVRPNIGGTEIIDSDFLSGRIQMYPEYLGEIASVLANAPPATTAEQTYAQAQGFEQQPPHDAEVLAQAPYQNIDVVVVRRDLAERYGLHSVGDLAKLGSEGAGVSIAAQQPFRIRSTGLVGLQQAYDLPRMQMLTVTPDETYGALDAGQVQAADGFSTDAEIASGKYVQLTDPAQVFGFQYMAPVVTQPAAAADGPAFVQTCDWVSSLLTRDAVRQMNEQVQREGLDEATVAAMFLRSQPEWGR